MEPEDRHVALLREALTALEATIEGSAELLSERTVQWGAYRKDRQSAMAAELAQHRATAQKLRDALAMAQSTTTGDPR